MRNVTRFDLIAMGVDSEDIERQLALHNRREPPPKLTRHSGRWNYYITDPYGVVVSNGGFLTRHGARRAAERKRKNIARELGNKCGF